MCCNHGPILAKEVEFTTKEGTYHKVLGYYFSCSGDPDLRLLEAYCDGPDELPEEFEQKMRLLRKGDHQPKAKHLSLKDLSSDGRVYLRR